MTLGSSGSSQKNGSICCPEEENTRLENEHGQSSSTYLTLPNDRTVYFLTPFLHKGVNYPN